MIYHFLYINDINWVLIYQWYLFIFDLMISIINDIILLIYKRYLFIYDWMIYFTFLMPAKPK